MTIYWALLVAVVGGLVYLLVTSPKVAELGRLSFFAGLWVFLLQQAPHMISVIR